MNTTATHQAKTTSYAYRYEHPRLYPYVLNDMIISKNGAGPGDKVEAFDLPTTDGGHIRSADLKAKGQPVLLVFGSLTCPITEGGAEGLKQLHALYGKQVRFVMIKVREAHPGGTVGQAQTFEEKRNQAIALKSHHDLPFEVAIDDIDGTFHRSLDSRPNSAYVIDPSGTILFHAQWANETQAIGEALKVIVVGKNPTEPFISRTMHSIAQALGYAKSVHDVAGKGALLDTWKVVPPLGMMMLLTDFFFFLPRNKRGLPAMLLTMGLMTTAMVSIIVLIARFAY
ncbi:MAG: redoxin domain-containing protein [Chloroflexi bacterium]|nr:redoxin domain-containing protein [Chloroflexota bacterium]